MVSFEGLNNSDGLHKQNKQIKENHSIHDLLLRTGNKSDTMFVYDSVVQSIASEGSSQPISLVPFRKNCFSSFVLMKWI
jgi:hypothetical protein